MSEEINNNISFRNHKIWLIVIGVIILIIIGIVLGKDIKRTTKENSKVSTIVSPDNQPAVESRTINGRVYIEPIDELAVDTELGVRIMLDTGGKNINLAKVVLKYDPTYLKYLSFDDSDSVLSLAIREDDTMGEITISRGERGDADANDTDDGFTGSNGLFGRFVFKSLKSGTTRLILTQGVTKLFLDDGLATEMKLELQGTSVVID